MVDEIKTYAEIRDARVNWIFTTETLPEWDESVLHAVEITGMSPQPEPGWDYDSESGEFTPPAVETVDIEKVRADAANAMNATCRSKIYLGFSCDALGAAYHYPANDKDQINLMACVTDSYNPEHPADFMTPFWCEDADGAWEFRPHTLQQIRTVGSAGKADIATKLYINAVLQDQIAAAATIEAINAIAWPE